MSNVSRGKRSNELDKLPGPTSNPPSSEVEEVEVICKMWVQESKRVFPKNMS